MTTETLDKLYLEWSQFTSARTKRENDLLKALRVIADGMDSFHPAAITARAAIAKATNGDAS